MTLYSLEGTSPQVPDEDDFWIAPGAHVIGDVTISAGVSIWFGATLRGDNEGIVVGAGSNIQDGCVLHTDPGYPLSVGRNCTIGHKAILHGCTVGDGSLIGMGVTVLNGARIGSGCLIGAGALVTEGKEIPDGSLVMGAPGKVVRQLDSATQANLLQSAKVYRDKLARYRDGLVPI